MSVRTLLPIVGVGSVFALIGLARARRNTGSPSRAGTLHERAREGSDPRRAPSDGLAQEALAPVSLTPDFWERSPSSEVARAEAFGADSAPFPSPRPSPAPEAYDAVDVEDLSLEWLRRATQTPGRLASDDNADDPAEIPADSVSMVSEASRWAASPADEDPPSSRAEE